jgi:hypothetical protein
VYTLKHSLRINAATGFYTTNIVYKAHSGLVVILIFDDLEFLKSLYYILIIKAIFWFHIYYIRTIYRESMNKEILAIVSCRVTFML